MSTSHASERESHGPAVRRRQRWPFFLAGGLLALGLAIAVAAVVHVPYYGRSPGVVQEVGDFIFVDGETFAAKGDLYFLTVSQRELTALEWVEARLDGRVDIVEREVVRPAGVTKEQRKRQGLDQQEEAKNRAIFVALSRLGFEAELTGEGVLVVDVLTGTPADGVLDPDDLILAVNGAPVGIVDDLTLALSPLGPGDSVVLEVDRFVGDTDETETLEVPLTLGVHPDEPERGFIGVQLTTFNAQTDFELDIRIDSQNIGGPSAGMMYTLGIINLLTEEDVTKGHRVAGTGTIERDGTVGPIGGVRQKVFTARNIAAEYILVPVANFDDALTATGGEIEVIAVETIDEALTFLGGLEPAS